MKQKQLWDKFESHMLNEQVTKKRLSKLKTMFNVILRRLNPEKATRKDIEQFLDDLNRNKFKKADGKEYSGSTKSDIKKFLRQFYKWLRGNNEFYPKEVSWIKTRISKDEKPEDKPVLTIAEVQKLANSFIKPEFRILTLLLFDSGFRIQEMLSTKKRDLTWEGFDEESNKCFWLSCNESKTEKRKVPIPLFTEDIRNFVNSSYYQSLNEDDPIFKIGYSNYIQSLRYASQKNIKTRISPHALRHSSATYYAREYDGNMNLLSQRYGWAYGSKQLNTYIRRSGAYHKQGAKKVFSNDIIKVQEENRELKERLEKLEKATAVLTKLVKKKSR